MRKLLLLLVFPFLISSCIVVKKVPPLPSKKPAPTPSKQEPKRVVEDKLVKSTSALEYIERYKAIAISEMNKSGIPASITLAQGLLESGNGNSTLAREANNHFGIKCTPEWTGKKIYKDDDQEDDCFRVYGSPEESFRDHTEFLKRKRYAFLFELDKNDYTGWAHGLKQAGYATNPRYAELLIGIIERYTLNQYDKPETEAQKIKREDKVLTEIVENIPEEKKEDAGKPPVAMKIYEVKQGDTLYSSSKKFGLTVDELKILNNITGTDLKLGQLLLVSK